MSRYCFILCLVGLPLGCSGNGESGPGGTSVSDASTGGRAAGGTQAATTGGQAATGSSPSTGGVSTGGTSTVGGATVSGGAATGGQATTGGTSATGGAATGGAATGGAITGGQATMGGTSATGGTTASGGTATGGKATTGGSPTTGGAATGGRSATGGAQPSGGTATGGKSPTGGTPGSGGGATGGSKATGGTTSTSTFPVSTTIPTVYLAGDSTVQTYATNANDQQGWGQRLQEFFTSTKDVVVVNKAIGGRSSKSFIDEGRLAEIIGLIKQGDYLFAQWGINDRYTSDATRYTDPATTFRTYLKQYVDGARSKNAIPVLVTPTPRHQYVNGVFENAFQAYCDAIKIVGSETKTPVIDLQTKALAYYTSVGDAYVSSTLILDVLHFKSPGAYQMARLVAQGVQEINVPISQFVLVSKLTN